MTESDWPAAVYDQAGQLVDLQYNASSIHVVNHLSEGANGKRCPKCNASPMARTHLVWEEHTRRHNNGTMLLSNIARRVAPPGRPSRPAKEEVAAAKSGNGPTKAAVIAVIVSFVLGPLVSNQLGGTSVPATLALPAVTLIVAVSGLVWARRRRSSQWQARLADADARFNEKMKRYHAAHKTSQQKFRQWQRSWFCKSCSAIVAEEPGRAEASRRPPRDKGKPSRRPG